MHFRPIIRIPLLVRKLWKFQIENFSRDEKVSNNILKEKVKPIDMGNNELDFWIVSKLISSLGLFG